jgi:hypothetical protein
MKPNSAGVKLISLLLTIGGAVGIGVSLWAFSHAASLKEAVLTVVFAGIFGWATWTGVELWRNKPRAYKWALILLVFQIPNIAIPAFAYQFYTGLSLLVSFSPPANVNFEFHLASLIAFQASPDMQDLVVGINVVAIAALIWLLHVFPRAGDSAAPK